MRTKKRAMCTIRTKSVNDVMRNKNFGGTHINEIPSKGSSLSTTPSSHSNLIDDVDIPIVTDPCYNVEPTLDTGFEMDRLQLYKEWLTRDNVNPFIRDSIQVAYNTTIFDKDNATNTEIVGDDMQR